MIKYQLHCEISHEFEGWFSNSADYDSQKMANKIECPVCDSFDIAKCIMAPNVARSGASLRPSSPEAALAEATQKIRAFI